VEAHFSLDTDALHCDPQWGRPGNMVGQLFGRVKGTSGFQRHGDRVAWSIYLDNNPQLETCIADNGNCHRSSLARDDGRVRVSLWLLRQRHFLEPTAARVQSIRRPSVGARLGLGNARAVSVLSLAEWEGAPAKVAKDLPNSGAPRSS
jgi:hypothetical protein